MSDPTPHKSLNIDESEENNVVDLQLIRGGKADTLAKEPPTDNWLLALKVGTTFLCKSKLSNNFALGEFELFNKKFCETTRDWSVLLHAQLNEQVFSWVNPYRFVNQYDLAGILYEPKDE